MAILDYFQCLFDYIFHFSLNKCPILTASCMDADMAEGSPSPAVSGNYSWTADGVWPSGVQHAIEYRHTDGRLRALAGRAARAQPGCDDGLVAAHRRFDQRAPAVAGFLLPAQPILRRHHGNVPVALGGMMVGGGARHRGHMRRNAT